MQISSSPHIWKGITKNYIMGTVILALMPAVIASIYYFGLDALLIVLTGVFVAWATDFALQKLTRQFLGFLNLSSILTGLLLSLVLPPTTPLWIVAVGSFVAVSLGKFVFGTGNSIFNPALLGRAFVVLSWPQLTSDWVEPGIDGITQATPLAQNNGGANTYSLFIGDVAGCIGETSAVALIIGGVFLILKNIINWKIPAFYIGTVALIATFTGQDPLFHILAGGLLLGAFFMATDYVTTPLTTKGKIFFAIGCGILTILFRLYSSMPEGVMFSILLMNAMTPLIDKITTTKPFGYNEKN
ncbi:MAG: RnfABCDGE type electron transport complex subunit D [Nanoarchaeota archaeon]